MPQGSKRPAAIIAVVLIGEGVWYYPVMSRRLGPEVLDEPESEPALAVWA